MTEQCSRFQIAFLGSGRVGKTCILQRYMYGTFLEEYVETVEDLYSLPYIINGRRQNIDFIDTAGNISFPAMQQIYFSKAHGFVLVYSINNKESFEEVKRLWEQIKEARKNVLNIPCVIIGNNLDEENNRQIETFDALDWACSENLGSCFLEVSAKENTHVNDVFKILFEHFGNRRIEQKGLQRLRSTSICRLVSESESSTKKKRFIKKSQKLESEFGSKTFHNMVYDNYKQSKISRVKINNSSFKSKSTANRSISRRLSQEHVGHLYKNTSKSDSALNTNTHSSQTDSMGNEHFGTKRLKHVKSENSLSGVFKRRLPRSATIQCSIS